MNFASEDILGICSRHIWIALRFRILSLLIHVHLNDLIPSNSDNGVIRATIPNERDFTFLGVVRVQIMRVDSRVNVENFQFALIRAYN